MAQAVTEMEKYLVDRELPGPRSSAASPIKLPEDSEFDALLSTDKSVKKVKKEVSRKRNASEGSGSTASGPSSSTAKKPRGRLKTRGKTVVATLLRVCSYQEC